MTYTGCLSKATLMSPTMGTSERRRWGSDAEPQEPEVTIVQLAQSRATEEMKLSLGSEPGQTALAQNCYYSPTPAMLTLTPPGEHSLRNPVLFELPCDQCKPMGTSERRRCKKGSSHERNSPIAK